MAPAGSGLPSGWRRLPQAFPGLGCADPGTGYGEALDDRAVLLGDDGDGAQVVGVEVARGGGLVGLLDEHPDQSPTDDQVVGPLHPAATQAGEALGEHPGARQVQGGAGGAHLAEALVLGVVLEADRGGAARDGGGLVVGGVGDTQSVARGHVALGVVAEGGVDHLAA